MIQRNKEEFQKQIIKIISGMKRPTDGKRLKRSDVFNLDVRAHERGTQSNEQHRETTLGFFNHPAF